MLFQGSAFLTLTITWACISNEYLDTQFREKADLADHISQGSHEAQLSLWQSIPLCRELNVLRTNAVYMLSMMAMTTLNFGAAGLQFWTISYMQVVLGAEAMEAQAGFAFAMFTALIPGVFMGATLADHYGGYKGKAIRYALTLCCTFGGFATIFSFSLMFVFEKTLFLALLWLFFFSGAGIMPIGVGIIIGCVPKFAQNSASALYCILMNTMGLSLSPIAAGYIMGQYKDKKQGMIKGYRLILSAGFVLFTLFLFARLIANAHIDRLVEAKEAKRAAKMREAQQNEQNDAELQGTPARQRSLTPNQ